jgi:uncharacterized protein YutE (UPF0331/DUF86 family)
MMFIVECRSPSNCVEEKRKVAPSAGFHFSRKKREIFSLCSFHFSVCIFCCLLSAVCCLLSAVCCCFVPKMMLAEAATACSSAYTALKEMVDESTLNQEDFKKLLKRCNRFETFVAHYDTTSNDTRLIENFRALKSCFQNIQKLCVEFTFKKTENPPRKTLIAAGNIIQAVIFETNQL